LKKVFAPRFFIGKKKVFEKPEGLDLESRRPKAILAYGKGNCGKMEKKLGRVLKPKKRCSINSF